MTKAMSVTESLIYTAGKIFGTKSGPSKKIESVDEAKAFAAMVNGFGGR